MAFTKFHFDFFQRAVILQGEIIKKKPKTNSPKGNDAHLRGIIQSEKNGNRNFSDAHVAFTPTPIPPRFESWSLS